MMRPSPLLLSCLLAVVPAADKPGAQARGRSPRLRFGLVGAAVPAARGQTVPPLLAEEWKFDVVHRKGGREPYRGLVTEQTRHYVHIRQVFRRPGSPTVVLEDKVPQKDVARLELLGDAEREQLKARLDSLKRERRIESHLQLWKGERVELPAGEAPSLKPAPWGRDGRQKGLEYASAYFRLVSNAREDLVRLTAIQLEQVFTAYVRCLPPRVAAPRPTTILLTRTLVEYHGLVRARGHNILNPAFFDPARNQVVCGSDLERLAAELERVREAHEKARADLQARRAELVRIYNRQVPPELTGPIDDALRRIEALERKNGEVFKQSHRRLLQRLCHESLHAYLAGSVFGEGKVAVPPWLDEGLAQVFETAPVEGGEVRLGAADPARLARVQASLRKNDFLPLATLLKAGPRQFQVAHAQERQVSDRTYLASWALAFYFTFEQPVLGTADLDEYLKALARGTDPLEAFRGLAGRPLSAFEKDFHHYLRHLREDGASAAMR